MPDPNDFDELAREFQRVDTDARQQDSVATRFLRARRKSRRQMARGVAIAVVLGATAVSKLWLERDVIVCGNEAIAILQGVVTREGAMQHVGPLVDHFTFDDSGKISMMRAFWKYA